MLNVLVTGARGFIGKNFVSQMEQFSEINVFEYHKESSLDVLKELLPSIDFICHFAGVNRPDSDDEFFKTNCGVTEALCDLAIKTGKSIPIIFTSSIHVEKGNAYGKSKEEAETILINYSKKTQSNVYIYRLPHVIGKWCRPNYNSVVATFCHNIANNLPIRIDDPDFELNIVYIDDLIKSFYRNITENSGESIYQNVDENYKITVRDLADQLSRFKKSRSSLITEDVGQGLCRALYSTYISYLPIDSFSYKIPAYGDNRGTFVEMLKTKAAGQFSFFTCHPGIKRGQHFHHTKTEKFLVIQGTAKFKFKHIIENQSFEIITSGDDPEIVETIPGWGHNITNIGDDLLIVMLWANEIFDKENPDTYGCEI